MSTSTIDLPYVKRQFIARGFAVVPGVLSLNDVSELREVLVEKLDRRGRTDLPATEFTEDARLSQVPFKPDAVAALRFLLGDDFVTIPEFTAMSGKYGPWHRDAGSQGKVEYIYDPDYGHVECAIYLQDSSPEYGGGLDVVPRSHYAYCRIGGAQSLFSRGIRKIVSKLLKPYSIPSKAGDLVIFDFRLMHRATPCVAGPPTTKKLAVFWGASRKTRHVDIYMEHLRSRGAAEEIQASMARVKYPDSFHELARDLIVRQAISLPAVTLG